MCVTLLTDTSFWAFSSISTAMHWNGRSVKIDLNCLLLFFTNPAKCVFSFIFRNIHVQLKHNLREILVWNPLQIKCEWWKNQQRQEIEYLEMQCEQIQKFKLVTKNAMNCKWQKLSNNLRTEKCTNQIVFYTGMQKIRSIGFSYSALNECIWSLSPFQ